ncbi:hypothetical protein PFISCL1PPCAC_13617 [Pristionchus fissidentatus]|uniref:glucuronosyltransferase n=1 Tax=Pristionchus fissidentatus TaxID=1538716 RepID=A0AAV5VS92_9BILA|nr:hypothetical protein PFISCL1PPCAC_13617 [Pristionchus fissidentatus]
MIVIPVVADQLRNAHQIERNGNGIRLEKRDLASIGKLELAIRNILEDGRYRKRARSLKQMLTDRPFSMKKIFVKHMEFLARHGPLRQLDHYGRHLNFFPYYLVDVIAFVLFALTIVFFFFVWTLRCLITRIFHTKLKNE